MNRRSFIKKTMAAIGTLYIAPKLILGQLTTSSHDITVPEITLQNLPEGNLSHEELMEIWAERAAKEMRIKFLFIICSRTKSNKF